MINSKDYEINCTIEPLTLKTKISIGDIVILWNKEKEYDFQAIIEIIEPGCILTKKMADHGIPVKIEERHQFKIVPDDFENNKLFLISDLTNDKYLWPATVKEAIKKLESLYENEELKFMKTLTWNQFDNKFNSFGGLSMWIRNYFGLYRGNFDLALDCQIEEPSADNVSSIIVYYFWEYLRDCL